MEETLYKNFCSKRDYNESCNLVPFQTKQLKKKKKKKNEKHKPCEDGE